METVNFKNLSVPRAKPPIQETKKENAFEAVSLKEASLADSLKKKSMGKDDFLKLFLVQLKNQDPMQPRDSHELASQLAQFTSLEKLENIESGLRFLGEDKKGQDDYRVLNLIGKKVMGDFSQFEYSGQAQDLRYELKEKAQLVEIELLNAKEEVVRKWTLPDQKEGLKTLEWDGLKQDGSPLPQGTYHLKVKAKSKEENEVPVNMGFEGRVSGVNFTKEGPLILLGDKSVKLSEVKKIFSSEEAQPQEVEKSSSSSEIGKKNMKVSSLPNEKDRGDQQRDFFSQ